jgi:hypothetical protein
MDRPHNTGWSRGQVVEFAKRFSDHHKACWPAYVDDVREAMIDSFVLMVVLGQDDREAVVDMDEVRLLRSRIDIRLHEVHEMRNVYHEQSAAGAREAARLAAKQRGEAG